jgi:hypothetical protein
MTNTNMNLEDNMNDYIKLSPIDTKNEERDGGPSFDTRR